jgi:hypothetical protein
LARAAGATFGKPLFEFLLLAGGKCIPFGLQAVAHPRFVCGAHRFELRPQLLVKGAPLIGRHRGHLTAVFTQPHRRLLRRQKIVPVCAGPTVLPLGRRPILPFWRRSVLRAGRRTVLALIGRRRSVLSLIGRRRIILGDRNTCGAQEQAGAQACQQKT